MAGVSARQTRATIWRIDVLRQLRKQRIAWQAEMAALEVEIAALLVDIATLEAALTAIRRRQEEGR